MEIVRPEFETNKELKLNVIAAENVRQAMWWARFMAIVGFFVTGLLAVFALGCMIGGASWGYAMNSLFLQGAGSYGYDYMGAPFVILGVVYLIIAVISFCTFLERRCFRNSQTRFFSLSEIEALI